jgi:predicted RNA binding protein YcfA (HicA-like mRNA interferase family)
LAGRLWADYAHPSGRKVRDTEQQLFVTPQQLFSGAEIVRALEKLGFEQVRQRGSHVVLRRGSSGTVVPLHRPVKIGTLAGILRQAGVSQEEFLGEIK